MVSLKKRILSRVRPAVRGVFAAAIAMGFLAVATGITEATPKYAAIVVDTGTGRVLYEVNADARRYPASLTKMMTLYVLFEDLERGRFKPNSKLTVSKNAAAQSPSKIGLRPGQTITVDEAIRALVTKSANDASAVIAENLAGSVPAFAERMTRTARAIGMDSSNFRNASGLPDSRQYTTARDMMKLGVALQVRFPRYYAYFQTRSFTYRGRTHGNHNKLLGRVEGVDGIKTGYINASGFNLVSSVKRGKRKIVAVVMGGRTARSRDAHMVDLINTYLPKASRSTGWNEELIAEVKAAPKVVASAPGPAPAALPASLANHPLPTPRPMLALASLAPDPAASAPPAPLPAEPRMVRTTALPVEPLPPALNDPQLPSTAAEAFGDPLPPTRVASEADALTAMIEQEIGSTGSVEAVAAGPVMAWQAGPTGIALETTADEAAEPPPMQASAPPPARGWVIQVGAVESERAATKLLQKAQSKAGKALAGASPLTESFAKGSQTYVRARFAGFESQKAAARACAELKKNAMNCYTLRL